jgi:hypothetical protein
LVIGTEQGILAESPHAPRRSTDAFVPKPGPDRAVAFALKATGHDLGFEMNKQILIGE